MKLTFYALILLFTISSCDYFNYENQPTERTVEGLKPIYDTDGSWKLITFNEVTPFDNLGKFYYKDNHLYIIEREQGIHIVDNSDPANPRPIKFISVQGASDIAIKNNVLYVDNISDLVAINIDDFDNMFIEKRVEGLYSTEEQSFPEGYNGFFECVDPDKGTIVGWESALLINPGCSI